MITLTDENFETEIQNASKPVLVDFWAIWCTPCHTLTPILEKLEKEFEDYNPPTASSHSPKGEWAPKVIFAKVNVDESPKTSQKFGIDPIPTVILFKEGKPISGFIGARPEGEIRKWLEENLKNENEDYNPPTTSSQASLGPLDRIIKEYEEYAKQNKFSLNPNREVVKRIVKGLLENEKKYGKRYCPCRRISGNPEEDRGKICPCQWHREEIERDGRCLCGLFVR